ncbi:hypothetical protein PQX77_009095 [Marasmius sp. AFHP31]|nr:hypothetical protein PQX77_009095 [Marasmius sp. AFHP31]
MDTSTFKNHQLEWDQVLHVPWSPSDSVQTPGSIVESLTSVEAEEEDVLASRPGTTTSTAFQPGANIYHLPSDTVLVSLDLVCFHVHSELLLVVSQNRLNTLLPPFNWEQCMTTQNPPRQTYIDVPEHSQILNIILHVAYGMSVTPYAPTFDMLSEALDRLTVYGIEPKVALASTSALHSTFMMHAPLNPIALYALASKHDCYELAASTSTFLLSHRVENMTDVTARNIGPVYLARLFSLQWMRLTALRQALLAPVNAASTSFTDAYV